MNSYVFFANKHALRSCMCKSKDGNANPNPSIGKPYSRSRGKLGDFDEFSSTKWHQREHQKRWAHKYHRVFCSIYAEMPLHKITIRSCLATKYWGIPHWFSPRIWKIHIWQLYILDDLGQSKS